MMVVQNNVFFKKVKKRYWFFIIIFSLVIAKVFFGDSPILLEENRSDQENFSDELDEIPNKEERLIINHIQTGSYSGNGAAILVNQYANNKKVRKIKYKSKDKTSRTCYILGDRIYIYEKLKEQEKGHLSILPPQRRSMLDRKVFCDDKVSALEKITNKKKEERDRILRDQEDWIKKETQAQVKENELNSELEQEKLRADDKKREQDELEKTAVEAEKAMDQVVDDL